MAATVQLIERNGSGTTAADTVNPENLNMGATDAPNLSPTTHPITAKADGHAFEKWLRLKVTDMGGSTIVDNIKVWLSSPATNQYATGEGLSTNARTTGYTAATYPTGGPVDTNSAVADQAIPTTEPSGGNLGIGGVLSGQITAANSFSDYLVLQLDVEATTPAGALSQKTITFQYDEQ